jgi:hypothetical protein
MTELHEVLEELVAHPGILLIAIASGIAYTAYRLFMDMQWWI